MVSSSSIQMCLFSSGGIRSLTPFLIPCLIIIECWKLKLLNGCILIISCDGSRLERLIVILGTSCCRLASASASASVRSVAEEEVESPSSEEMEKYDVNEVAESSVCSNPFQCFIYNFSFMFTRSQSFFFIASFDFNFNFVFNSFCYISSFCWRNPRKLFKERGEKEQLQEEGVEVHLLQREGKNQIYLPSIVCSWTRTMRRTTTMTMQTD